MSGAGKWEWEHTGHPEELCILQEMERFLVLFSGDCFGWVFLVCFSFILFGFVVLFKEGDITA